MKTWAWRIVYMLFWGWFVLEASITFVIWAFNIPQERFGRHFPHAGQQCGPEHHWRWVGVGELADFSCERDR